VLVVDGRVGFLGGYNLGSLYATAWRDTHLRLEGPAVAHLAGSFVGARPPRPRAPWLPPRSRHAAPAGGRSVWPGPPWPPVARPPARAPPAPWSQISARAPALPPRPWLRAPDRYRSPRRFARTSPRSSLISTRTQAPPPSPPGASGGRGGAGCARGGTGLADLRHRCHRR
jgi:phosphatidylserine/phosphatidylglycerophosphate/cardiolipin synthase-like enzyme